MAWLSDRRPDPDAGLMPVAVQDADSGELLMVAYANREALEASERTGEAHFWSRSRDELWRKGATSGNTMALVDISTDCDGDAIRYRVRPAGPACHTGTRSCFPDTAERAGRGELARLAGVIEQRRGADPAASYTARLLEGGARRPAEKVSEEAGELVAAALAGSEEEMRQEAADLLYHVLVLLAARGITLAEVEAVLAARSRKLGP